MTKDVSARKKPREIVGWTWIGAARVLQRTGQVTIYRTKPIGLSIAMARARLVLDPPPRRKGRKP